MANIVGYSGAYLKNINSSQLGVYQAGSSGALVSVFEPKVGVPEKQGDAFTERFLCTLPATRFDGTALVAGDQFFVMPLPAGMRVYSLNVDVTTGSTGTTYAVNVGNNTSATAYASALDTKAVANTAVAVTVLDAASAGVGNNDAVILAASTVTAVATGGVMQVTVSYGNP